LTSFTTLAGRISVLCYAGVGGKDEFTEHLV